MLNNFDDNQERDLIRKSDSKTNKSDKIRISNKSMLNGKES